MDLSSRVWFGALSAIAVSILAAVGLSLAGMSLEGTAEQLFEGITMLVAAGLLTWMIFWMHRQSRFLRGKIENNVRQALVHTGGMALFWVAFLAVVREGIELALLLVAVGMTTGAMQNLIGSVFGLAAAVALGWLLFSSTRRLPLGRFFQVTNILLILFAAGLVAHGVHEFNEAGLIPSVIEHLYNINPVLDEKSVVGQLLTALFGYNGNPSLTESIAYVGYFVVLLLNVLRLPWQPATVQAQRESA
jgi:high-affinity iron transporter